MGVFHLPSALSNVLGRGGRKLYPPNLDLFIGPRSKREDSAVRTISTLDQRYQRNIKEKPSLRREQALMMEG